MPSRYPAPAELMIRSTTSPNSFGGSTPVDLRQLTGLGPGSETDIFLFYGNYFIQLFQSEPRGAQRQWNFVDTLSLSSGRHQFKFGVDYRRLAPFVTPPTPQ